MICWSDGTDFSYEMNNSGYLMYYMVSKVNNTLL